MIFAKSRRTIMDGEVVTFAAAFGSEGAMGPFEVSASRNAVMVHRSELRFDAEFATFQKAMLAAQAAMSALSNAGYGAASLFSDEPTEIAQ